MSTVKKYQTLENRECSNCHAVVQAPVKSGRAVCPQCGGTMFSVNKLEQLKEETAFEEVRKEMGWTVDKFYAVPRDPPSSSKLPIFDKAHVKNAMARFSQTEGLSDAERARAIKKILAMAKKFGIDASGFREKYASD